MEQEMERTHPDIVKPQRSKRAEALLNLTLYFESYLKGLSISPDLEEVVQKHAEHLAIDAYKIVKRAEGFDV